MIKECASKKISILGFVKSVAEKAMPRVKCVLLGRGVSYKWQECGGPPESTGRGMQEEIRSRTREAPICS